MFTFLFLGGAGCPATPTRESPDAGAVSDAASNPDAGPDAALPGPQTLCSTDKWCWRNPLLQGNALSAVFVADASHVFAVGTLGSVYARDASSVWAAGIAGLLTRWNGTSWSDQPSGTTEILHDIDGRSGTPVFAVGLAGSLLRLDGTSWSRLTRGDTTNLYELRGVHGTGPADVWAVGDAGTILLYDGSKWSPATSPTSNVLARVFALAPGRAYAVGQAGVVVAWNGTRWATQDNGAATFLFGLWGSPSRVFAVGGEGAIVEHAE